MKFNINNNEINYNFSNENKQFVFIISSYNNAEYVTKNLDSVICQTYVNWRIIYIDDASSDNTVENVNDYLINHSELLNKFTFIKNTINMKQAYNRFHAYKLCNDNEIICFLDGDDWLYDYNVLNKINEEYCNNRILLTYGSYFELVEEQLRFKKPYIYSESNIRRNMFRTLKNWVGIPMRTGLAFLYKYMPEDNMKDHLGNWMTACTDIAEFLWAIEHTQGLFKAIEFPTYVYNIDASVRFSNCIYNLSDEQHKYRSLNSEKIYNYRVN